MFVALILQLPFVVDVLDSITLSRVESRLLCANHPQIFTDVENETAPKRMTIAGGCFFQEDHTIRADLNSILPWADCQDGFFVA